MRPAHVSRKLNGRTKQCTTLGTPRAGMNAGEHSFRYAERGKARVGIPWDCGLVRVIEVSDAIEQAGPSMSLAQATSIDSHIGGKMALCTQLHGVASAFVVTMHALHTERCALVDSADKAKSYV